VSLGAVSWPAAGVSGDLLFIGGAEQALRVISWCRAVQYSDHSRSSSASRRTAAT
jgi:hypothetical protein